MSADVTNLLGQPIAVEGKPCAEYVELLENALARAKAGETTGGFLVEAALDGIYYATVEGVYSLVQMMGNVELLKSDVTHGRL